ncbi:S1C family serine protease [Microbacterium sp. ASV81]|uniref:Trypsin-like peptidase domain-containing protein n=1 Tax=Microbacterium capsulatum TaxID=3041921 RepID=A0ABU0XK61_9MICO|nr:trypsin-like peptidase domain-containing protein [Microbacterium sp. ASV81]MDQ4214085.1 trypsin-like peptidase domain-containing protein [Microbacterium sp. ASV81]
MSDQTPQPDAGHSVPPAFSSTSAGGVIPPVPGTPADASATAPTQPIPPAGGYGIPPRPDLPAQGAQGAHPGAAFGVDSAYPAAPAKERRPGIGGGKVAAIVIAAALVGGIAGVGSSVVYGSMNPSSSSSKTAAGPSTVTVNNPESVSQATAIAAKAVPSVVTIDVSSSSAAGSGSGIVLDKQGHILTNAHVVTLDGAVANPTISVTTSDGRILTATVVGIDPVYDMAVIQVKNGSSLTPMEFADSSKLNVGAMTVAVGAPLGLSNSVTTGIVSALNRSIQIQSSAAPSNPDKQQQSPNSQDPQQPFQFDIPGRGSGSSAQSTISISVIQTDAAINPGNSGGALVDSTGKLIGVNVAIASAGSSSSSSGQSGNIGVGFAIPSSIAHRIANDIIANGKATHGLLGASVQDASSLKNATVVGAAIASVTNGGAAATGGLQAGDIVTGFNGNPVTDASDLTAQVRAVAAGSKATLTVVRGGSEQTITVTLGTLAQ